MITRRGYGIVVLLAVLLLTACGVPAEAEQEVAIMGGATPEEVVTDFFVNFNAALQDPEIDRQETRRMWAERLSSYFAPSERVDQRVTLQFMLANYAERVALLGDDQEATLEVSYEGVLVRSEDETRANVRLLDGFLRYRQVHVAENGYRSVVYDDERPLNDVLGKQQNDGFPVLQVGDRWFLTER
jgi:hypothetical protein